MSNDLGRDIGHTRTETREARQGAAVAADGAGQRHQVTFGLDPRRVEAERTNGLLANRLLSALPAEEFSRLLPHLEPAALKAGEVLYKLDAEMRYAYFPETAVVSHLYILTEGGMTESDMVGREGMTGLSAVFESPAPSCLSEVALAGSALRARVDALRHEFARGGALQRLLLRYAGARLATLSRRAVCNGNHLVEERLCTWLLMMFDRSGDAPLALTHERISRHLGTRRAGVTSAATQLRDRGLIGYTRGSVRLLDRGLLEAAACECYPSIKESFHAVA
ncbi:MAG TPA: Crp/Fnr family transcriptional regulator [Pyrinomonadaceae bacterium]